MPVGELCRSAVQTATEKVYNSLKDLHVSTNDLFYYCNTHCCWHIITVKYKSKHAVYILYRHIPSIRAVYWNESAEYWYMRCIAKLDSILFHRPVFFVLLVLPVSYDIILELKSLRAEDKVQHCFWDSDYSITKHNNSNSSVYQHFVAPLLSITIHFMYSKCIH